MRPSTFPERFGYSTPASEAYADSTDSRKSPSFKMRVVTGEDVNLTTEKSIFIRDSNIVRRLNLDDILYAEAMGDFVKLYLPAKCYIIHTKLKVVEEKLPASKFLRVHRSYLVALDKIDSLEGGALIINGKPLPIANAHRSALNERMNVL